MKTTSKKAIAIILGIIMIFSLAGCTGGDSSTETDATGGFARSGEIVFEDNAGDLFRFGLLMAGKDGMYSFINKENEVVIDSISDDMDDCGLFWYYPVISAFVEYNGRKTWECFDIEGNLLIDPSKYMLANESCTYGLLTIRDIRTGKIGYFDTLGNMVIEPQFDEDTWWPFANCDLSAVKIDGKWGYIDKTGKVVIEPQFDYARNFCAEGVAAVAEWSGEYPEHENRKYALINTSGELLTDYIFDDVYGDSSSPQLFVDGVGIISMDKKKYFYDTSGKIIKQTDKYYSLSDLKEEKLLQGKTIFEAGEKCGIKDANGNIIVEAKFDYITHCYEDCFVAWSDRYCSLYNYTGKLLIGKENEYSWLEVFDDGYVLARKNMTNVLSTEDDKYGVLDKKGNIIIPFEYDSLN